MARTGLSVCRALAMSALVACAAGFVGCGAADGDEIVYLHVVHGYAGAASLSMYGPEGSIVTGLQFGTATDEPIAFDRSNFDGTLTIVMDNVPGAAPVTVDLFALYPQETVTLFVQRRSNLSEIQVTPIRHHVFSPAGRVGNTPQCYIAPRNLLSLSENDFSAFEGAFSYMVQMRASADLISRAYNPTLEQTILTECGPLSVAELGSEGQRIQAERARVLTEISANPLLFPVQATESNVPNAVEYVYGRWVGGTTVVGPKTSIGFIECISTAVQIKQDDAPADPADPAATSDTGCDVNPSTGAIALPRDPVTNRPLVTVDAKAVTACFGDSEAFQGFAFVPGQFDVNQVLPYFSTSAASCQGEFVVRTPITTTIYDQGATRAEDQLPLIKLDHPDATTQSVILFGRPLDPLVHQFTNAERSEATGDYPADKPFDPFPPATREEELPGRELP